MNKKEAKKVAFIILIVFVVVLAITGIICVNLTKRNEQELQLDSDAAFMNQIRDNVNSKPLTDDQFMSGLDRLFPTDNTDQAAYLKKMRTLSHKLDEMEISHSIERINYFGTCACLLQLNDDVNVADLQESLQEAAFDRVYIHVRPVGTVNAFIDYLYDNSELLETYNSATPIGEEISNEEVLRIYNDICAEYELLGSTLTFTGEVLQIRFNNIRFTDALDIFDFLYRWCRQSKIETTIRLYDGDILLANALISLADTRFETYHPADDLAATFRIKFYLINDYLKDELREASERFLIE